MRVVLVASLALNLGVIGTVVGASFRSEKLTDERIKQTRARSMQERDFGMAPFLGALDSDARRMVGRAFVARAGAHESARQEVRANLDQILSLLSDDPFDADAFRNNLLLQYQQFSERQEIGAMILTDYLVDLSPEARTEYVNRLQEILARPARGGDIGAPPEGGRETGLLEGKRPPRPEQP
jgi:uncharacterized membrane protein